MARFLVRTTIIITTACALVYLSLFLIVKSAGFQNWLKSTIADRTGYELKANDLGIEPPLGLVAYNAAISRSAKTLLQSEKIALTFTPIGLLSRRIHRLELVKPTFYIDPQQWIDSSSKTSFNVTLRHLNIRDGTIVLETGGGNSLDFRSIMMDAENVNLGGATGLDLRMELPWLSTGADIAVRGEGSEKIIAITIQQTEDKRSNQPSAAKNRSAAIRAELKLRRKGSRELEIQATGQLNDFKIANEQWSSQFNIEAGVDAAFKEAIFSGKFVAPGLPPKIGAVPLILNSGPITATIAGNYSFAKKAMLMNSLQLVSASGIADGRGRLDFIRPFSISDFRLNLRNIPAEALKSLLPEWLAAWTYSGTTEAELELEGAWSALTIKGTARSQGTNWKSKQFSLAELSLQAPFRWAQGSLSFSGLRLAGKKLAIDQEKHVKISAEEIFVDGGLEKTTDAPLKARGTLQIRRGRFANLDDSKVGENLALTARFDAATIRQSHVSVVGGIDIEQGEILWEKFFTDFKSLRPMLSFDGDYAASDDAIRLRRFNLSLANVGSLALAGTVDQVSQSPLLGVTLQSGDLKPGGVFDFLIRDALKNNYPILDQLVVGGRVGLSARAQGRFNDLSASGILQLQGGSVGVKSNNWQMGPIGLTLPFRIHLPSAKADSAAAKIQAGTLVVESARFGTETIPTVKTILSMRNNVLRFEQPIRLGIYGGTVEIGNLVWNDVVAQPEAATFSVDVQNLQLQRLTEALDWSRFSGTASGSIPRVESAGKLIRTQGQIQIQVFRGRIQITKLEIENPFSSLFSVKLDTRFQDIDLEELTKTFEFGRISGILEGSATDLVIVNGQPAQFVADFHTVEKSGVSQWISVEALNKITVLSSGTNASALYGGLTRLFDSFRYSRLGFKATLKNDKLTLRGIESRDGKEYLVVGSFLPPTVNVISHTQEIGFGELLRRLKQIQKSDKPKIN